MEKINTEMILSSLFLIGFDRVDEIFLDNLIGKILYEKREKHQFELEEEEPSDIFNFYFEHKSTVYKLKDGYDMNSIVQVNDRDIVNLKDLLLTNDKLLEYLCDCDFKDVIEKKIKEIGIGRVEKHANLFSNREKEIMAEMYRIELFGKDFIPRDLKQEAITTEALLAEARKSRKRIEMMMRRNGVCGSRI